MVKWGRNMSLSYNNVKYTMMSGGNLTVYLQTSLFTYALSSHQRPTLPLCNIHK